MDGRRVVLGFEALLKPVERLCTQSWREHCMLTGLIVCYWSSGKSKWGKSRFQIVSRRKTGYDKAKAKDGGVLCVRGAGDVEYGSNSARETKERRGGWRWSNNARKRTLDGHTRRSD